MYVSITNQITSKIIFKSRVVRKTTKWTVYLSYLHKISFNLSRNTQNYHPFLEADLKEVYLYTLRLSDTVSDFTNK